MAAKASTPKKTAKSPKKTSAKKTQPKIAKVDKKAAAAAKDAGPAPKRAQSAFFIWLNANRAEVIQKAGLTPKDVTKIGKAAGDQWKTMSDADKAPWQRKADDDKKRYTTEMA